MFLKREFSNRLVQISIFSGIVYYITAYPVVFEKARKYFPIKFKRDNHQLLFHTFVFSVLMYILTYFLFDPLVNVVEGLAERAAMTDEELAKFCRSSDYTRVHNLCPSILDADSATPATVAATDATATGGT